MSLANHIPSENQASPGQFHTTHWSVVLTAGDAAIPGAPETFQMGKRFFAAKLTAFPRGTSFEGIMGHTHVTVTVSNLQKSMPGYTASFLVDTGAIVCLAPAEELRKAGIEPEGREAYELANGAPVKYDYGFARLSFMGSDTVTKIIFGSDQAEPLLCVTALESVGIGVDPVTQTLKRYAALPLKVQRSPRGLTR